MYLLRLLRTRYVVLSFLLLLAVAGPPEGGHSVLSNYLLLAQSGPITVLSREGRRTLPTVEVQNHQMVGLDDLANLFQLQIRDDAAARAVTATYKNQTIVLTPDQSLVSASGRLVSLPVPMVRRSNRWLVPVEFINRALAPVYDTPLDFRPASRLLVAGDLRVPRVTAQYDESPNVLRVTFEITPRLAATVTQEQNRLLVRIEADALDASLPPPASPQGLLTGIRVADAATIQLDLGPRFNSFRASPPVSRGAAAVVTVEIVAAVDTTAAPSAPGAAPNAPDAPNAPNAPNAPASHPTHLASHLAYLAHSRCLASQRGRRYAPS